MGPVLKSKATDKRLIGSADHHSPASIWRYDSTLSSYVVVDLPAFECFMVALLLLSSSQSISRSGSFFASSACSRSLTVSIISQPLIVIVPTLVPQKRSRIPPPPSQKKQGEDRKERWGLVVMEREEGGKNCSIVCINMFVEVVVAAPRRRDGIGWAPTPMTFRRRPSVHIRW